MFSLSRWCREDGQEASDSVLICCSPTVKFSHERCKVHLKGQTAEFPITIVYRSISHHNSFLYSQEQNLADTMSKSI